MAEPILLDSIHSHKRMNIREVSHKQMNITDALHKQIHIREAIEKIGTKVSCSDHPSEWEYCQHHILLTWNSKTRSFNQYKKALFVNGTFDVTLTLHSTYP